jgi:hypothetical protein
MKKFQGIRESTEPTRTAHQGKRNIQSGDYEHTRDNTNAKFFRRHDNLAA